MIVSGPSITATQHHHHTATVHTDARLKINEVERIDQKVIAHFLASELPHMPITLSSMVVLCA